MSNFDNDQELSFLDLEADDSGAHPPLLSPRSQELLSQIMPYSNVNQMQWDQSQTQLAQSTPDPYEENLPPLPPLPSVYPQRSFSPLPPLPPFPFSQRQPQQPPQPAVQQM